MCALALVAAACSTTATTPPASTTTSTTTVVHGTATVACAGSLDKLYNTVIAPAFKTATGDTAAGPPCQGSSTLAQEIVSKEISPGAFLAVGLGAIKTLFPARAKFAIAIATDPIVVAYSSKSRYFTQLNAIRSGSKPLASLFSLLATPGFRLGRTDPSQDPQGIFFILMTKLAQTELHLPAGQAAADVGITASNAFGTAAQMVSEDALPVDISTGVFDAGSEYLPEAIQYGLDYIKLPAVLNFSDPADLSTYSSVSLDIAGVATPGELIQLNFTLVQPASGTTPLSATDEAADQAFLDYMLSSGGRTILSKVGYTLIPPRLTLAPGASSATAALPASVLSAYNKLGGSIATS